MHYEYCKYIDDKLHYTQQVAVLLDKLHLLDPNTRIDILYDYGVDVFEDEEDFEREMRAMEKCL